MKYLDEDINVEVSGFNVASADTYYYDIAYNTATGLTATYETIFVGNCWLNAGDTSKTFYLNDILNNCRKGFDNALSSTIMSISNKCVLYELYKVTVHINNQTYYNVETVYLAYRYPNRKSYLEKDYLYRKRASGVYAYNMLQGSLLPHIPYKLSNNFPFIETLQFNINSGDIKYKFSGGVTGIDKQLNYDGNSIMLKKQPLSSLLNSTLSNGTDGLVSLYREFSNYTDIIDDCDINLSGDAWSTQQYDEFTISQPTAIEIYDYDETECLYEFTDEQLHSTSKIRIVTEPKQIDFSSLSEAGIEIPGVSSHSSFGSINITSDTLSGTKYVRVSFDYQYDYYEQSGKVSNIKFEIADSISSLKLFDCAVIDACAAKYYLIWQDRYGSYQSQAFDKTETFSENFDFETIKNYKNEARHSIVTSTPKWKINSGWIDEKTLPYYESIYTSQQLLLYDSAEDKCYQVNVLDSNYTEKTFKNQGRKLFNMQLELELSKKQTMIY